MDLAEIRAALGLPENTNESAALTAMQTLKDSQAALLTRAEKAEGELATIKAARVQEQITREIEQALTEGRFAPADRGKFEALAARGLDVLQAALSVLPPRTVPVGVAQASGTPTIPAAPLVLPEPGLDPGLKDRIGERYGLAK